LVLSAVRMWSGPDNSGGVRNGEGDVTGGARRRLCRYEWAEHVVADGEWGHEADRAGHRDGAGADRGGDVREPDGFGAAVARAGRGGRRGRGAGAAVPGGRGDRQSAGDP